MKLSANGMLPAGSVSVRGCQRRKRKFTLIELLIVISIIVILAGMLLPALNQAKSKARNTHCSGNIKTLLSGGFMYAAGFDDWWVPNYKFTGSPEEVQYGDCAYNSAFRSLIGQTQEGGYRVESLCPASDAVLNLSGQGQPFSDSPTAVIARSYVHAWVGSTADWRATVCFKLTRIVRPTAKAYWTDGLYSVFNFSGDKYFLAGEEMAAEGAVQMQAWRHSNGANTGYFDGHVNSMKRPQWQALSSPEQQNVFSNYYADR